MTDQQDIQQLEESLNESSLPEAPLSTHIDAYYKGFHVGFTHRSNKNETPVANTVSLIGRLIAAGYEPSWNKQTTTDHLKAETTATPSQAAPQQTVDVSAICPIHSVPLEWKAGTSKTTGKPYGFWACPARNADGSYCKAGK